MDALSSDLSSEVGLMGPAQGGKTEIGLAWLGRNIDVDPGPTLIAQPSQQLTQVFVETRINPMIEATSAVKDRLSPELNANNIWLKKFRGMFLYSVWPVAAQFTQRPVRYGWLDDYDQFPDDIEGQGSAISLLGGRDASYEGREKKFVSSSPAREDGGGVEAFVSSGTDEHVQPACPQCGDRWEIDLLRDLRFEDKGSADDAEGSAHVVCGNGCVLEPGDRRRVLASLMTLPHYGFVAKNTDVSKRRRGFSADGLLALTSWPKLARLWREAQIEWEVRQDETLLRTFVNTKAGKNYRSALSGEEPVSSDTLKARREVGLFAGTVPAGVKVWCIQADVQHDRVECMAFGWGDGLEGWIIERFAIDVLDDGLTQMAPFSHPEHSAVLLPLFNRRYKLADGSGWSPPPLTVQLDVGGGGAKGEGATGFAKAFWDAARALGVHKSRITLTKGGSRPTADLMPRAKFSDQKRRGGPKRTSAELWLPNVHRIKNTIDARLRRADPGPGFIHIPGGKTGGVKLRHGQDEGATGRLLDVYVDEITAEELQKGKWVKIRPRNETLDLLVAAYASILRPPFAQSRTHMRWVPLAFRVPEQDGQAVPVEDKPTPTAATAKKKTPPTVAPEPSRPVRRKSHTTRKDWIKPPRRSDWINRRR